MRVLRKIAGVKRIDHMRNDDIRTHWGMKKLWSRYTEGENLVWKKQVEEQAGSITETVMSGVVPGKRPRGRLRKRWSDAY